MLTDIYRIKTNNSIYEIQATRDGRSRCRKVEKAQKDWRTVDSDSQDYLERLYIGASFDVPGVVLTSVVKDYQHFTLSEEPKRRVEKGTTIPEFFGMLAEHVVEQVQPQAVMVAEKVCGIDGCTVTRVPGLPSHEGGRMCKSGSIASGGSRAHCACDYCY